MAGRGDAAGVERVATIGGCELHYWVYRDQDRHRGGSQDSIIVMVHGLRGTHQGLELISSGLPGRCVVVPDLPGFGASSPMPRRRHDVRGYAEAVTGLITRFGGGTRPVVLLGHSFGSVVAAHIASSSPELVCRLVLVNPISTPALNGSRAVLSKLTPAYYSLGEVLPERIGRALLSSKWIVLAASRAMVRTKDKQVRRLVSDNHLQHFSRFHSPARLNETFRASVSHTVADYADSLRMPTLVIAGADDDIAPLPGQRAFVDRVRQAELSVIPEVGHLVHYEKPVAAATEIERFLSR